MVITQWHLANEKSGPARLIALIAGALTPLAFAPFFLWPLALMIPALFWWVTVGPSPAEAFRRGWLFGLGFFGAGVSWVYSSMRTVETGVVISLVLTLLFCAALGLLFAVQALIPAALHRRLGRALPLSAGPAMAVFLAALWSAFEGIRSTLFTGMPWLLWGTVITDTPMAGWLPLIGVYGAGLLLLLLASGFWLTTQSPATGVRTAGVLTLVLAAGWPLGTLETTRAQPERALQVAALQSNVPQLEKWSQGRLRPTLDWYQQTTSRLADADLIVWPETAITAFPEQIPDYLMALEQQLLARGQGLIAGLPVRDANGYYNAVRGWGEANGEYRKRHLVPFGEYLPLRTWLDGLVRFFSLPMSGWSAGSAQQPPIVLSQPDGAVRLGVLICYEAAYPRLARDQADGAGVLVVVSNDAWFGRSLAPAQHLQISRTRALETGRPMIRATQNGLTALIDHRGQIAAQAEPHTATLLTGTLVPRVGSTPFQRWGNWPVGVMVALILVGGIAASRR